MFDREADRLAAGVRGVMDLIVLVLVVALIGFLVFVITTKVPMPPLWASALQVLALIVILLYVLGRFVRLPNVLPR